MRLKNKAIYTRAMAALIGLLSMAGCSSDREEASTGPQPVAADSSYPDINTVPNERPQPTILNIFSAPQGLKADDTNATNYGEPMVGGPTSNAAPPPPPPPPPPAPPPQAPEAGADQDESASPASSENSGSESGTASDSTSGSGANSGTTEGQSTTSY